MEAKHYHPLVAQVGVAFSLAYSTFPFCRPGSELIYGFSKYVCSLNEPEEGVAPTDCRLRPDVRIMEQQDFEAANAEKVIPLSYASPSIPPAPSTPPAPCPPPPPPAPLHITCPKVQNYVHVGYQPISVTVKV